MEGCCRAQYQKYARHTAAIPRVAYAGDFVNVRVFSSTVLGQADDNTCAIIMDAYNTVYETGEYLGRVEEDMEMLQLHLEPDGCAPQRR